MTIQDRIKVSVAENETPPHKDMGLVAGHAFEALEEFFCNEPSAEGFYEVVVVDCLNLSVDNGAGDIPWVDILTGVPTDISRRDRGGWIYGIHRACGGLLAMLLIL